MPASPKQKLIFAIDDSLTVDENIVALALKLKTVDAQLTSVLTSTLTDFSNEVSVDQDMLLNALYDATAPTLNASEDVEHKGVDQ